MLFSAWTCTFISVFQFRVMTTVWVNIDGPGVVKPGETMMVNCTSNVPPVGDAVEILVNGISYTNLRGRGRRCFSSSFQIVCSLESCQCSADGRTYLHRIQLSDVKKSPNNEYWIMCAMNIIFNGNRIFVNDSLLVKILEKSKEKIISIKECKESSSLMLSCSVFGKRNESEIGEWTHSRNGIIIRYLQGQINNGLSLLEIRTCGYQDVGTYTCTSRNVSNTNPDTTDMVSFVSFKGAPVIVDMEIYKFSETILSVSIYSHPAFSELQWLHENVLITNNTNFIIMTADQTIDLQVYGRTVLTDGFVSNLTTIYNTSGLYEVLIANEFGETRRQIVVYGSRFKQEFSFDFRIVMWTLIVICLLILSCPCSVVLAKKNHFTAFRLNCLKGNKIYYAAPGIEERVNTYDVTDPHYMEPANIIPLSDYLEVIPETSSDDDINHYIEVT